MQLLFSEDIVAVKLLLSEIFIDHHYCCHYINVDFECFHYNNNYYYYNYIQREKENEDVFCEYRS